MLSKLYKQHFDKLYAKKGKKDIEYFREKYSDIHDKLLNGMDMDNTIEESYAYYKKNISPGGSAVSLKLARLLYLAAQAKEARNILDLGSGFSSYVFRLYRSENPGPGEVWSVDSDPGWLGKTGEYLASCGLADDNLFTWEQYAQKDEKPIFDVILVDIRPVARRVEYFEHFLTHLSPHGVLIYDDYHKLHLSRPLDSKIKGLNLIAYNLREITLDDLGRFCLWIEKQDMQ